MVEIYLDNAATTATDADVAAVAVELMTGDYGNPSSLHQKGLDAQLRMEKARQQVAALLDCTPEEITFTSGGTEANNLAVQGGVKALRRRGNHIITTAFEHSSVLSPVAELEKQGFSVTRIQPGPDGIISPQAVVEAVREDTILVSCMLVNSETGAINPVEELARAVRKKNELCLIHCDAVQAFGKLALSVRKLGVDLLTLSGHKIHAPKGCGALYIRRGVRILPLVYGGSQENSLRPGTENTALACALGGAAEKAGQGQKEYYARVQKICEYFVNKSRTVTGLCINSPANGTPYIVNVSLPGYRSEIMLHHLEESGIYVSSGSACAKGAKSHVLLSMGLPPDRVDSALRLSFSRYSTIEEVDAFFAALEAGMTRLVRR